MRSYYALKATLRYYDNESVRRWTEPPHYHFANLQLNEQSILAFVRRYGLPYREWRQGSAVVNKKAERPSFVLNKVELERMQALLRRAWRSEIDALADIEKGDPNTGYDPVCGQIKVDWSISRDGIVVTAQDLWSFIRMAFLRDYAEGRIGVCANPDCLTPYFLLARKGQDYCSHKCAVLINVRRFRQQEARKRKGKTQREKERKQ